MDDRYNGWTNYATWRVNLEVFDGLSARDCGWDPVDGAQDLVDLIKDYAEQIIEDTSTQGLARDYALAFIFDVDWREIAARLLDREENGYE